MVTKLTMLVLILLLLLLFIFKFYKNELLSNTKRIVFLSFGGGGPNYVDASYRIAREAYNINIFTDRIIYTDNDIKNDFDFWNKHGKFIENNKRGYGYWLWKSYINNNIINLYPNETIVFYADSGCEFNENKKELLLKYINELKSNDDTNMIVFYHDTTDNNYTKKDLLNLLECNYLCSETSQITATSFLYKINDITKNMIKEWYEICSSDYHNIDDSPSISNNHSSFNEHRHDQSVFSLLSKKYNWTKYPEDYAPVSYSRKRSG
jgi:hypothetical protein